MATCKLREAINRSSQAFTPEVDEFKEAGVAAISCINALGLRVCESPCHMKCKYITTQRLTGNSPVGSVDVVLAEVARIRVCDDVLTEEGKIDVLAIKPIARLGYYDNCTVDKVFEMKNTGGGTAAAGLEGRSPTES